MRLMLTTRHRRCIILTGDDATAAVDNDDTDEVQAVVSIGGQFEPAPPPFGFTPDEDDE
jgi:hypothetical protein